jgi:hypothetical protein
MSNPFFDRPILNSPYVRPLRHWELDAEGQPTQKIIETRRRAEFITPIPKPKTRKGSPAQQIRGICSYASAVNEAWTKTDFNLWTFN